MTEPMVELKSVILMPTLHLDDLTSEKKVSDFVTKMRAYVVNNPNTWMYQSVFGDCWDVLSQWNDTIVESRKDDGDEPDEVQAGFSPSDDVLVAALLGLFDLGESEGARANFTKIKMKSSKNGNVHLPDIMAHQIAWTNMLKNTPDEHWPARAELIKIFIDSIYPMTT